MRRFGWWLAGALVLSGCTATFPVRQWESPAEAMSAARVEADAGRWSVALQMLEQAGHQFPGDAELAEQRLAWTERWQREKQHLEDRLEAERARALLNEIEIMEPLVRAEPERFWLGKELVRYQRDLAGRRAALVVCGRRQLAVDQDLALHCSVLADRIASDETSRALLRVAKTQLAEGQARDEARQVRSAASQREQLLAQLLEQAESQLKAGDYAAADATLRQVLAEQPEQTHALALQAELNAAMERQAETLNVQAARQYAEGDIEAAIRLWEASLRVAPRQPEITDRLERARRVLDKLLQLREEPPAAAAIPGEAPTGAAVPATQGNEIP